MTEWDTEELVKNLPAVSEVRQCGFIAGIELKNSSAVDVCLAARQRGLLARPIRNVIVLMLPLCITSSQLSAATEAIRISNVDVCHGNSIA